MDRRYALAAAFIVVGLLGVASPLVLFEYHDERYAVTFGPGVEDPDSIDDSEVVPYGDLPPETRRNLPYVGPPTPVGAGETVEESYGGFTAAEWDRADTLRDHEYVRLPTDVAGEDGSAVGIDHYRYESTPRYLGATGDALFTVVGGALALALGGLLLRPDGLFPLRSEAAAGLAAAGLAGLGWYRLAVANSLGNSPHNHDLALAFASGPGSAAFALGAGYGFVAGTAVEETRRRVVVCLLAGVATLATIPVLGYGAAGPTAALGGLGGTIGLTVGTLLGVR